MIDSQPTNKLPQTIEVRSDLKVHIRNDERIILEDPARSKHYRIGLAEYAFFVSLRAEGDAVAAHLAATKHCESWSSESSQQLLGWFASRGLISLGQGKYVNPLDQLVSGSAPKTNPLFARLTLGFLESRLTRLAQVLSPFVRREVAWVLAAIVCFAIWTLATSWSDFQTAYQNLFTPWRALGLSIVGMLLKLLHEVAHAVACHHGGGKARGCGGVFIFGLPLPFVDVSDSCRFPSRTKRIAVALAGVLLECSVAACLVCLWCVTESPVVARLAADTVLVVALGAILFNLNPLMKFDGYYVLAELLGIDNLYSRGASYASALLMRVMFGIRKQCRQEFPLIVKLYGVAAFAWRVLALLAIYCTAIITLQGIGILLVLWAVYVSWIGTAKKAWQAWKIESKEPRDNKESPFLWLRPVGIVMGMFMAMVVIPLPAENSGNAVVEYDPPAVVRTLVGGFVDQIHIIEGQHVSEGELLVTLRSDCLPAELARRTAQQAQLEQELRSAVFRLDSTEYRHAQAKLAGLRKQRTELQSKNQLLELRAPADGFVSTRQLVDRLDCYLESGTEVAVVGLENSKRLRLLVQQDLGASLSVGGTIRFLSGGGARGTALVDRVLPRSTQAANGSVLSAEVGGPISVEMDQDGSMKYYSPHSQILATLSPGLSEELRVGQSVSVALGSRRSLGQWLWSTLVNRLGLVGEIG